MKDRKMAFGIMPEKLTMTEWSRPQTFFCLLNVFEVLP